MLRISAFPPYTTSPSSDVRSRVLGGAFIDVLHVCDQVSSVMTPTDTFCWPMTRSLPFNQAVCLYLCLMSRVLSERFRVDVQPALFDGAFEIRFHRLTLQSSTACDKWELVEVKFDCPVAPSW